MSTATAGARGDFHTVASEQFRAATLRHAAVDAADGGFVKNCSD
jgi:hypothetical protein